MIHDDYCSGLCCFCVWEGYKGLRPFKDFSRLPVAKAIAQHVFFIYQNRCLSSSPQVSGCCFGIQIICKSGKMSQMLLTFLLLNSGLKGFLVPIQEEKQKTLPGRR